MLSPLRKKRLIGDDFNSTNFASHAVFLLKDSGIIFLDVSSYNI